MIKIKCIEIVKMGFRRIAFPDTNCKDYLLKNSLIFFYSSSGYLQQVSFSKF